MKSASQQNFFNNHVNDRKRDKICILTFQVSIDQQSLLQLFFSLLLINYRIAFYSVNFSIHDSVDVAKMIVIAKKSVFTLGWKTNVSYLNY